jgi:hypothetical protein
MTRVVRKLDKRSMTSASAAMEQTRSGQIGQPAACMIENNPVLSTSLSGFSGGAIMA